MIPNSSTSGFIRGSPKLVLCIFPFDIERIETFLERGNRRWVSNGEPSGLGRITRRQCMAYILPMAVEDVAPAVKPWVERALKHPGYVGHSLLTLARKPEIANAFRELHRAVGESLTFPDELRSMMWAVMAHADGNPYSEIHAVHAVAYIGKVPTDKLAELWDYETSQQFNDEERAALRYAEAVGRSPKSVGKTHYDALRLHYSEEQIVEMIAVVALGGWLLTWNKVADTDLEEMPVATVRALPGPKVNIPAR